MFLRARLRSPRKGAGARRHPGRLVRRGVAGVVLAFVVLGSLQALTVPVFQPPDELSHWGYARLVAEGRLPRISTRIPVQGVEAAEDAVAWRSTRKYRTVWVANHPPLYYLVMAGPVRAGVETGITVGVVRLARVLSVLIAAGGLVLVAGIVRELVPRRPALAVAAAGLAAMMPTLVKTSSNLYNDSLAFTTAMATLLLAVRILMRGPTGPRVVLLAVFASAAALTRASGLVVAGVAGLAVAVRPFLPAPPDRWRGSWAARAAGRVAEAVRHGAVVGIAVVAAAGWFYQRNLVEYGDLTGSDRLLTWFDRSYRAPVSELLTSWEYYRDQARTMADYTFNMQVDAGDSGLLWYVTALPALGFVAIALRHLFRLILRLAFRRRQQAPPERTTARTHLAAVLALMVLLLVLVEFALAQFVRDGGGLHARYLFPSLPLLTLVGAVGLAGLPGGRRGLLTSALLAGMIVANVWLWNQYLWIVLEPQPGLHTIETAFALAGVADPADVLVPAGVALLVAVALQASALWSLGARPGPAMPAPLTFQLERQPEEPERAEEPQKPEQPEEPEQREEPEGVAKVPAEVPEVRLPDEPLEEPEPPPSEDADQVRQSGAAGVSAAE